MCGNVVLNNTIFFSNPVNLGKIERSLPNLFQETLICAGDKFSRKGLCHGDSGGPIINFDSSSKAEHFVQSGVVHGGILECSNNVYPAIFVRLDHPDILDFVQNAIYPASTSSSRSRFIQNLNVECPRWESSWGPPGVLKGPPGVLLESSWGPPGVLLAGFMGGAFYRHLETIFFMFAGSGPNCQVMERGTWTLNPCSFPFIVDGKRFDDCTDFLDPDGKFWCSTRTDPKTFQHVNGQGLWGFCNDRNCPTIMSNVFKICTKLTLQLTKPGKRCF